MSKLNAPELKSLIARTGVTNRFIAKQLGISEQALNNKVKGASEFKSSEIKILAGILGLSMSDVNYIFFDSIVN